MSKMSNKKAAEVFRRTLHDAILVGYLSNEQITAIETAIAVLESGGGHEQ